jgi:hypothetical protein
MSEIGPKSRPPLATELYAAGRLIGNKCFDENFEVCAQAALRCTYCAAPCTLRVAARKLRPPTRRASHAAPRTPLCTVHTALPTLTPRCGA